MVVLQDIPVLCLQYAPEKKVTKPKEEKGWWDRWFGSSDEEEEEVEVEIHEEKGTHLCHIIWRLMHIKSH